jgi:putative effector of murein hydrolase
MVHTMLVLAIPYWKIEWALFEHSAPVVIGLVIFMMLGLMRGKPWIKHFIRAVIGLWCLSAFAFALYEESAVQALFGLFLSLLALWYFEYLNQVFESPYLSP